MARSKHHLIVYCAENESTAAQLTASLKGLGYDIQGISLSDTSSTPLLKLVGKPGGAVLMLVTDNYLKSSSCMHGALEAIREWAASGILFPVVAPGDQTDTEGKPEKIPTAFDRVSHVIAYMNYWQDRYLQLRKDLRYLEPDLVTERMVETVKTVSGEIGEFLRYLRNLRWHTLASFSSDNFQLFRQFNGDETSPAQGTRPGAEIVGGSPSGTGRDNGKSLAELIEESSEAIMAENANITARLSGQKLTLGDTSSETDDAPSPESPAGERQSLENLPPSPQHEEEEEDININEILSEALDESDEEDAEEFRFLGEDPENPEGFNLNSLFEEDGAFSAAAHADGEDGADELEGSEVLLNLVADDEEGLLLHPEGKGQATPSEVLDHALNLFDSNLVEEGLSYLEKTVEMNPGESAIRYYLAYALARYAARWEEARHVINSILQEDDENADAWFLLAEIEENQGHYAQARKCFEKVAILSPDYPDVFFRLGLLLQHHLEGQEEKAVEHYKKALAYNNNNSEACYQLASLLHEFMGDTSGAVRHFKNTLQLEPAHPFANYDLALIYYELGDFDKARHHYERAVAVNPELRTPSNDQAFLNARSALVKEKDDSQSLTERPSPGKHKAESDSANENWLTRELQEGNSGVSLAVNKNAQLNGVESPSAAPVEKVLMSQAPIHAEVILATPQQLAVDNADRPLVLVSGATSGIGRATAEIFASNGFRVIATGRRMDRLEAMRNSLLEKYQNNIQVLCFDVRNPAAIDAAFHKLPESWRQVDILINNAGLSRGLSSLHEGDPEHWDTMIDTNIKGLLYLTRAVVPGMVARRKGHIINVGSSAGKEVYPAGNVYCATKFAVDALTKSMRLDFYQHNIRVSQVSPGHVEETEFAAIRFDGDLERAQKVYDGFQPLKAGDVAEVIYFMATRPAHINIQDVLMFGTQQAGSNFIDRSGR
jgi:NADP-dependent 3-hydroxy acid dehydrogenase YdfG/tetratricopeptide (TPR) repeat protein